VLRTGTYFFQTLFADHGGTFEIDNTDGPVLLYVRNHFVWGERIDRTAQVPNVLMVQLEDAGIPVSRPSMQRWSRREPASCSTPSDSRGPAERSLATRLRRTRNSRLMQGQPASHASSSSRRFSSAL
jgi:hypothetical protein